MASAYHPKLISSGSGNRIKIGHGLEEASQTWVAGNLLTVDDTSGEIEEAANSETLPIGIAMAAASGVTSTAVAYEQFYEGCEVEFSVTSDGATVTDASALVVGKVYATTLSANIHTIDTGNTTTENWVFQYHVPTLDGSTSYRGVFTLLSGASLPTAGN